MSALIETTGRVQWWFYTVSHGFLLLRRPRTNSLTRLDLLFLDVSEVRLTSHFDDLQVLKETAANYALQPSEGRCVYKLVGANATGYIVAGNFLWAEDNLEYDAPSPLGVDIELRVVEPGGPLSG